MNASVLPEALTMKAITASSESVRSKPESSSPAVTAGWSNPCITTTISAPALRAVRGGEVRRLRPPRGVSHEVSPPPFWLLDGAFFRLS